MTQIDDLNVYVEKMYQDYCNSDASSDVYLQEFSDAYAQEIRVLSADLDRVFVQIYAYQAGCLRTMLEDQRIHWDKEAKVALISLLDDMGNATRRKEWEAKLGI